VQLGPVSIQDRKECNLVVARQIEIRPDSETAQLLREAKSEPLILVLNGEQLHLSADRSSQDDLTDEELWVNYDPALILEGLRSAAGSWEDLDGELLKEDIYRWRREGSRPLDQP
jgi:hypothetical protein